MNNTERYMPVGRVEIVEADTGKVVYTTHNIIVKEGRKLIINSIFNDITNNANTNILDIKNFRFFYQLGSNTTMRLTSADDTYSTYEKKYNINEPITNDGTSYYLYTINNNVKSKSVINTSATDPYITMDCEIISSAINNASTSIDYEKIVAIGLIYEKASNEKYLFSRAVIDPVYMNPNKKYIVHYTMYF